MPCADRPTGLSRPVRCWRILLAALITLLLTGCQSDLPRFSPPTPRVLIVQSTAALTALGDDFQRCAAEMDNTGLVLLERPTTALDLSQSAITLTWGDKGRWDPGKGAYGAVVGQEALVLIANPANPVDALALTDLQAIYTGDLRAWPGADDAQEIQPWVYPTGEDVQQIFESLLGGLLPSPRVAYLAPDPSAMREAVARSPNAVGFIPARWFNDTVKPLRIDGLDPARLTQPVLAWTKSEPIGQEKTWLICLQGQTNE